MPKPPLPPEIDEFLKEPNPSVIATLQSAGSPITVATCTSGRTTASS